jgi:Arc/MetJ-type ribon-helix-helix transcriptional regulator
MKKFTYRTSLWLPQNQHEKAKELIQCGKYESLSQVVRAALTEFFKKETLNT